MSPVPDSARLVTAICALLLLGLHAVGIVCLDLPQRKYQIPREAFAAGPIRAAFRFALELGTGARTYVTAVSPYALLVLIVLRLPPDLGTAAIAALTAAARFWSGTIDHRGESEPSSTGRCRPSTRLAASGRSGRSCHRWWHKHHDLSRSTPCHGNRLVVHRARAHNPKHLGVARLCAPPPWAWSFAGRSQVAWLGAIAFGVFLLIFGMAISLWYLLRVRPIIAAIEAGDLG